MKPILSIITLLIVTSFTIKTYAQDIKLKKDFVIVDGEQKFQYEKRSSATEFTLYSLDKDKEILTIIRNKGGTAGYSYDDYVQLIFTDYNVRVESVRFKGYSFKWFIELLLKEKVLNPDGSIDEQKLQTFFTKYDENVTNRTIR
ncbi:MAG TPA: hypothetical protein VLZ83_11215 [Edaphocola sp.]|nr:hypothetical protein [Edaphocola sp.]